MAHANKRRNSLTRHLNALPLLFLIICLLFTPLFFLLLTGTCVGAGNYRTFCIFLYCLSAFDIWVILFSIWDIVAISQEFQDSDPLLSGPEAFEKAMRRNPISFILAVFATLGSTFVLSLTGYHSFLIATGQTTNEQLKKSFPRGSPFHQGIIGNLRQLCCVLPNKSNIPNLRSIISELEPADKQVSSSSDYNGRIQILDANAFYETLKLTNNKIKKNRQESAIIERNGKEEQKSNEPNGLNQI